MKLSVVILASLVGLIHSLSLQIDNVVKSDVEYDDLTLNTKSGPIKGVTYVTKKKLGGREERVMNGWIGIPYAQPPIGELRFKAPRQACWNETITTADFPPPCFQVDVTKGIPDPEPFGTEDCLYLNVWAPHPRPKKTAVMVWIHGGAFKYLSPARHDPTVLVVTQDVVFVSVQYRHNIFGYLYMNDTENAPGNQALLDHVMAMQWVKDNIALFGGDPDQISIYGGSSGSVSINYHLLSPMTDNLFTNVIMQSGAHPLVPLPSPTEAMSSYTHFLDELGCREGNVEQRIACARKIPTPLVFEAAQRVGCIQYGPVIDGHYLPDDPKKLMEEGKFKKVPLMLGVNKNEASIFFWDLFKLADYQDFSKKPRLVYQKFEYYLKSIFWNTLRKPIRPGATDSILLEYTHFPNKNDLNKNYDNLDYSYGDFLFRCPTVNVADYFAKHNVPVFFYHFVEGSSNLTLPEWFGAVHGGEIEYMFGDPLKYKSNYRLSEKVLAEKMVQYWANFAKYDNPNGRANDQAPKEWPVYSINSSQDDSKNKAYLILEGFRIRRDYGFNEQKCKFWNEFFDRYY